MQSIELESLVQAASTFFAQILKTSIEFLDLRLTQDNLFAEGRFLLNKFVSSSGKIFDFLSVLVNFSLETFVLFDLKNEVIMDRILIDVYLVLSRKLVLATLILHHVELAFR